MIIHVTQAQVVGRSSLALRLSMMARASASTSGADVRPILEPLRDAAYFAQAYLDADSRTVTWPNGADLRQYFLYQYAPEEAPLAETV